MKLVPAIGYGLLLSLCAAAQSSDSQPPLAFEVASIKPSPPSLTGNRSINRAPGGELRAENVNLKMLLTFAYDVNGYEVLDAPAWTDSDGFDVFAKPSPEQAAKEGDVGFSEPQQNRLRERVRHLLADRFGLQAHKEIRQSNIFALIVAKGGSKLAVSTAVRPTTSWNAQRVICHKCTMGRFAQVVLSNKFGRTVVDRTDLPGEFDFEMHFVPDEIASRPDAGVTANSQAPTFITALEEQLGLRLQTTKGPEEFLIIDRITRPTEN